MTSLATTTYPDGGVIKNYYNRQNQVKEVTDQLGNVHKYTFDLLGRLTQDAATTTAGGVDTTVLMIARSYEVRGMLQGLTSYNSATSSRLQPTSSTTSFTFTTASADCPLKCRTIPRLGDDQFPGRAILLRQWQRQHHPPDLRHLSLRTHPKLHLRHLRRDQRSSEPGLARSSITMAQRTWRTTPT